MSLRIKEKEEPDGAYTHNLYLGQKLISDQVYINGNKSFDNDGLCDNISVNDFLKLKAIDVPKNFQLHVYDFEEEDFFEISNITRGSKSITLSFYTPFKTVNKLPFKEKDFYNTLRPYFEQNNHISFEISEDFSDFENNFISTHFEFSEINKTIEILIKEALIVLNSILDRAKDELSGFTWNDSYEHNESTFTRDLVVPLLRKLGFKDVQYTHGVNEFGRDIVFSKINEFNEKIYSAVQVKAGNISGKVRGEIDEIIQQLDDAFSMPLNLLGDSKEAYISSMIIIISGRFTENAKQKINHKINNALLGSISFLDKEAILNLQSELKKPDNKTYE